MYRGIPRIRSRQVALMIGMIGDDRVHPSFVPLIFRVFRWGCSVGSSF